jgi:hypothetical protein
MPYWHWAEIHCICGQDLFRIGSASQNPRQSFFGGMAFEDPALDAPSNRQPSLSLAHV